MKQIDSSNFLNLKQLDDGWEWTFDFYDMIEDTHFFTPMETTRHGYKITESFVKFLLETDLHREFWTLVYSGEDKKKPKFGALKFKLTTAQATLMKILLA